LFRVLRFTINKEEFVQVDVVADPERLPALNLAVLTDSRFCFTGLGLLQEKVGPVTRWLLGSATWPQAAILQHRFNAGLRPAPFDVQLLEFFRVAS
jgi:hypothetical protein